MRSLKLLALSAVLAACSSPAAPTDGGDGGGNPEGGKVEGGKDAGPDAPAMAIDINGSTDLTIHVQEFNFGMATPADLAGASVRVEISNPPPNTIGYLDGTTDSSGVAHIKVDTAKGPFDVTAALANYTAVSIIGLSGPLGTPIITSKTNSGSVTTNHTAAGAIGGKMLAGHSVQLDAPWWQTVNTTGSSYSNNAFSTANQGNSPPLEVTGLEIDNPDGGTVINAGYFKYMGSGTRPNNNITGFDMTLPGNASGFATANITVNWPGSGVLKGSDVAGVGDPDPNDKHLGKGCIVVKHFTNPNGDMFCGVGDTAKPSGSTSTVRIQAATSGDMQPTFWEAIYYTGMGMTGDLFVHIHSTTLTNGGMFTVGQMNSFDAMGSTFDDATYGADTNGYDAIQFLLFFQDAQQAYQTAWEIWQAGSKLSTHHIPHLPKDVKVGDIAPNSISDAELHALVYEGGSTAPWSETNKYASVVVAKAVGPLDQGSRP